MKYACDACGQVEPVETRQEYCYAESGVHNVVLADAPVGNCPKCKGFLYVSIESMSGLHNVIALAVGRKRAKTDRETAWLAKYGPWEQKFYGWNYRRRGQLIECYRPPTANALENPA